MAVKQRPRFAVKCEALRERIAQLESELKWKNELLQEQKSIINGLNSVLKELIRE
jgi:hypothetical protein